MVKFLTIPQLAEHCQAEVRRYRQTGQSNEVYCLELFHRALVERNEAAWQAIYAQYQPLMGFWVRNYSRFPQTGEEADFFIDEAFARLWRSHSKQEEPAMRLDSLGQYLKFLKLCVGSAIEDYFRRAERDAITRATLLEDYDRPISGIEAQVEHTLILDELREALWATVQDERERLVAEESWVYGFAPRQIQERHPETFITVEQVSQTKKNILKRLRRKLKGEIRD
jgi:RNA polymerase sigma factor (sigma-70 family)